jgi:hypothetical protein
MKHIIHDLKKNNIKKLTFNETKTKTKQNKKIELTINIIS